MRRFDRTQHRGQRVIIATIAVLRAFELVVASIVLLSIHAQADSTRIQAEFDSSFALAPVLLPFICAASLSTKHGF